MAERFWTVGSLPDCDIRVESPVVSGRHCRLTQRGESLLLEDLGSTNGTFVAGERLAAPRIVRRGDPVTLGNNTPLPWPPLVLTVTIGRAPDNDVVIPLDMVSGHHARLEQEGDAVYLVDLGSSNGTAVNDPLKKITRVAIQPGDEIFLGTHRVAAWELLKALPQRVEREATALERPAMPDLERELESRVEAGRKNGFAPQTWQRIGSTSSWAWGIGLSAVCALLILGTPLVFKPRPQPVAGPGQPVEPHDPPADDRQPKVQTPPREASPKANSVVADAAPRTLNESEIRRFDSAIVLIGFRVGKKPFVDSDSITGWACRPDAVICPTSVLKGFEASLNKHPGLDISIAVLSPTKTLSVVEKTPGAGPAEGFTLLKLEAPLETACTVAKGSVRLEPQQKLAVLAAHCALQDDPQSITRKFQPLEIDHVQRKGKEPMMIYCRGEKTTGDLVGAPVFDATGAVVGCVVPSTDGVDVLPVSRLSSLVNEP